MLDALRFQQGKRGSAITVTTDGLLEAWLADWRRKEAKVPAKGEGARRSDLFYTSAIGSDAAFTRDAAPDIPKPSDERSAVEEKGNADYHACFADRAPRKAWYPAVVKEAAALAARVAGH